MASVELRGLTRRYGTQTVVDDVWLTIPHGTLVCLLGPSGCGKTTTLRLIAGFIEPSGGEVRVGDRLLSSPVTTLPPERRNMSMIFQSYALWPHMTVGENIAYGLRLRKLDRATIAKKLTAILSTTHLAALVDRYPGELSGGQQQRVALARALVVEPETLLLDEPLSNLDANLREEMRFEIRRLHDEYRYTTVYVTHDQVEAMTTADQIAVMNLGRVEQVGPPQEVYDAPDSEFVARFLGASNIIKGVSVADDRVSVADVAIRCVGAKPGANRARAIAVRPHDIRILVVPPADTGNVLPATITRNVFLGASRDYMVELADGTSLRVVTPPGENVPRGSKVWLHMPFTRCRMLQE